MLEFDVIVPAGGTINPAFERVAGTENKALIRLEGVSVLANTLECIRGLPGARRIVVIGSDNVRKEVGSIANDVLPEEQSGPKNIFAGLRFLAGSSAATERVLIVTSDLPFLTTDTLSNFLGLCPRDKDFCVPLISKDSFAEAFPGAEATFVTMRDGVWTTGCAYLATPRALFNATEHIERVFENRKSKIGMARMLGFKFVWGYVTKTLVVADVEKKVKELLHCIGVAVPNSPPELAYDIDYIEDYHYALQALKLKKERPTHV